MNTQLRNTMIIFTIVLTGLYMLNACSSTDKKENMSNFLKHKLPYALIVSTLYFMYTCKYNVNATSQKINTNSFDDF